MIQNLSEHRELIDALLTGDQLISASGSQPRLIETHISSVLITDDFVYKVKKPLDLGFLDFSTLKKRQFYCEEEVRLNRRLSPQIYLGVIPVTGALSRPELNGTGEVLEYLVQMKPFAQECELDRLLERGALKESQVVAFASYVADFHQSAVRAEAQSDFGRPQAVYLPVTQNFTQIKQRLSDEVQISRIAQIQQWSAQAYEHLKEIFSHRQQNGYVRECHGDLHLRNLAWFEGQPMAFDCIEFNPNLYFIDVINDIAFLMMDLQHQQRQDLAQIFLNRYLEVSGDFEGLGVLRFYLVYRAMVRAKIDIIQATQEGIQADLSAKLMNSFDSYCHLAQALLTTSKPRLYIMYGPSACGKSTLAHQLSRLIDAVVIRSDIERKRLFDVDIKQPQAHEYEAGLYSQEATTKTYSRLADLASQVLKSNYSVIVDATFQDEQQRHLFQSLSEALEIDFVILEIRVSEEELIRRIRHRKNDVSDADIDILKHQLLKWRPLSPAEGPYVIAIDYETSLSDQVLHQLVLSEN